MEGLPPEAAVWRCDRLPPAEEYLALLVERSDAWQRAHLGVITGKGGKVPREIRIRRPGEPDTPARRVERDPRKIAKFFEGG